MSAPRLERCGAARLAAALFAAAVLSTCDRAPEPEAAVRSWPEGVVLAIDDEPIYAEDVDRASTAVQLIEPAASSPQLRRLALSHIVLPRALARVMAPKEREQARNRALGKLAEIRAGLTGPPKPDGVLGDKVEGLWTDLGLGNWHAALELPDDQWSEPIEDAGAFVLMRRLWRRDGPVPMATVVSVDAFRFDWIEPHTRRAAIDAALDQHKLQIVDPAWREIVPELYQYRMGARR